jgi:integrase
MARMGRLTALKIDKTRKPGVYADGGGLYLRVTPEGTKSWVYRFTLNGKARWMGLGSVALCGLQDARGKALDARRLCHEGVDPISARETQRASERLEAAKAITFRECAETYVKTHRISWRNAEHQRQWEATLADYANPVIGDLSVASVDTALVMKILEPLWARVPETASRLRGRIESILDWARVRGYRNGENPARWRGHLDKLLPKKSKIQKHLTALAYTELPGFMMALREQDSRSARALEFVILTAARTGEALGARWDEIDIKTKTWVVPPARMKAGKEHRVPLSPAAMRVIEQQANYRENALVFPGTRTDCSLKRTTMLMLLRRMRHGALTTHGFRATFKTWAEEQTNFAPHIVEAALAHMNADKVEAAYQRGDLLERRRALMNHWGDYCSSPPVETSNKVVALRA